jgi:hypothetical protein
MVQWKCESGSLASLTLQLELKLITSTLAELFSFYINFLTEARIKFRGLDEDKINDNVQV